MMKGRRISLLVCIAMACCMTAVAGADPTAGSLLIPPEETGPMSITYPYTGGNGNPPGVFTVLGEWPNYLTGMDAGSWRMEVLGIDMSGVTGPDNRAIYFQLANVAPYPEDTAYPWQWHSLVMAVRLDNDFGSGQVNADLLQCQETYDRDGGIWDVLTSGGYHDAATNRADLDLRLDFSKANDSDAWKLTPSFRLPGGDWTVFDQGGATTTYSWRFGAPPDEIWPGQGGTLLNVHFSSGAEGTVSFDNARIVPVPVPAAMGLGLLGLGTVGLIRRLRKA